MENYNIYLSTETEKYKFIDISRENGATVASVSGCGTGYYISIQATESQADRINAAWAVARCQ